MSVEIVKPETKIVVKAEDVVFDIAELEKFTIQAQALADNLEIINDKDEAFAIDALAEIKSYAKEAETVRKSVIDKPNKFVDRINGYFKPLQTTFKSSTDKIGLKLQFYRNVKQQRAEEERQKQIEQYNAKVEAEKLKAAREGTKEQIVAPPKALVEEPTTMRTATASATFIEFFDYEIVNIQEVYKAHPEIVSLDIKRRETLELLKTTQNIPGLNIFKNSRVASK
jgi:hypothetical protein